jgi:hypothetical protein
MVDAINATASPMIPKANEHEWRYKNRFYWVPLTFSLPQGMTRFNGWHKSAKDTLK